MNRNYANISYWYKLGGHKVRILHWLTQIHRNCHHHILVRDCCMYASLSYDQRHMYESIAPIVPNLTRIHALYLVGSSNLDKCQYLQLYNETFTKFYSFMKVPFFLNVQDLSFWINSWDWSQSWYWEVSLSHAKAVTIEQSSFFLHFDNAVGKS